MNFRSSGTAVRLKTLALAPIAAASLLALAGSAQAQQKAAPAAPAAQGKAAPAPAAGGPPATAWVKLCEKAPFVAKDKDGKEQKQDRNICLTHHERIDAGSGMVLVSAAIRQIEGSDKQHFMVMLPLGMALPPGMQAAVYPADIWDKIQKNEKVDDSKLKPLKLAYTLCHQAGCTGEVEATAEVLGEIKKGAGMIVYAISANGQTVAFPVPLTGFDAALNGPAADNAEYSKQRRALMQQIAENQQKAMEEYRKQNEQLQKEQGMPAQNPAAALSLKRLRRQLRKSKHQIVQSPKSPGALPGLFVSVGRDELMVRHRAGASVFGFASLRVIRCRRRLRPRVGEGGVWRCGAANSSGSEIISARTQSVDALSNLPAERTKIWGGGTAGSCRHPSRKDVVRHLSENSEFCSARRALASPRKAFLG